MTRWKKDASEFTVRLSKSENRDGSNGWICRVPKPIVTALGSHSCLKFFIEGEVVRIVGVSE